MEVIVNNRMKRLFLYGSLSFIATYYSQDSEHNDIAFNYYYYNYTFISKYKLKKKKKRYAESNNYLVVISFTVIILLNLLF